MPTTNVVEDIDVVGTRRILTKYRKILRAKLESSVAERLDAARDTIVGKTAESMRATLDEQAEVFKYTEQNMLKGIIRDLRAQTNDEFADLNKRNKRIACPP